MENWQNKVSQALRKSESFFRTDMIYLAKSGSWLSIGHVIAMVAGFLTSLAFANLFPKESFGNYKFILSVVGILGAFSLTGMSTAITQAVSRGFGGALRQGFRINLKWGTGMLLGGLALSIYYYINDNSLLSFSFLLAGIVSPITLSAGFYGGHLSAMEVIGQITRHLDKILIFHYLGAAPLAIYAFAIAPVEQLQGGKKILSTLITPKVSGRPFEELQRSTPRKALLLTAYALLLALVYTLSAPYLYKLFFPQYLDSVFYSQIYSLTLLAVAGTIFNETLIAHKKTKELYVHRTIIPIVQIILFFILLPIFGLMGLIITHVIMRSFASLLSYYFVMRPFKNIGIGSD